jgi:hypothetical protein
MLLIVQRLKALRGLNNKARSKSMILLISKRLSNKRKEAHFVAKFHRIYP